MTEDAEDTLPQKSDGRDCRNTDDIYALPDAMYTTDLLARLFLNLHHIPAVTSVSDASVSLPTQICTPRT